ncbi:hypothetical protein ACFC60_10010 [Kitasatospora purpeofusca]|uniref:hypothetical protein n=1 Tax=Kitasatospora purpeofusca TaxID=67352 RepID=UPI0035D84AED
MDYRSANDLPSFVEMSRQISGLGTLRHLSPGEEKHDVRVLRRQLDHMADTVDAFYALLGPRNWIFHESISFEFVAELVATTTDPVEAESKLIAYYNDHERLALLTAGLRRLPAMRRRLDLVSKASSDYFAGRYYACIHVLLSVMDGFVNEFETVRRGLHARQAEELKAWDSVVGHHMGLTNAHRTFTKGRSTTNEEPVYELYRNGIVHGSTLNYDNIVVATKAWNRLMAVATGPSRGRRNSNLFLRSRPCAASSPLWLKANGFDRLPKTSGRSS